VSFINEHGEEEAGIDGGGIFKDFMENITRAAFDVQYGLFKVSALFSQTRRRGVRGVHHFIKNNSSSSSSSSSTKGRAKKIPTLDTHPLLETSTEPQTRHKIEKCDQHSRMDKASCS